MSRNPEDSPLVLDAIAGRRANSKDIIRANCPFCEDVVHKTDRKQCLSVNVASGYWKCYRCASEGRLGEDDIPHDTATLQARTKVAADAEKKRVGLPESWTKLWTPEGQTAIALGQARKYLREERVGCTLAMLEAARVGACPTGPFRNRIVVPIYKAGKLAGYMGRLWWKKCPPDMLKYRYNTGFGRADVLYNEEALYEQTDEPCMVVEGIFDTFPFWPNAVAVLGKPSPAQLAMMLDERVVRPLFVVFDGDAHREATALAMKLRQRHKRAAALRLPPGVDPDECVDHVNSKARATFAQEEEAVQ